MHQYSLFYPLCPISSKCDVFQLMEAFKDDGVMRVCMIMVGDELRRVWMSLNPLQLSHQEASQS